MIQLLLVLRKNNCVLRLRHRRRFVVVNTVVAVAVVVVVAVAVVVKNNDPSISITRCQYIIGNTNTNTVHYI
jgi:hypothetical protein